MRSLYFGSSTCEFPDKWEELNKEQYLELVDALISYTSGKVNTVGCRVTWFCNMAGIDIKRRDNENDLFWENIYRAADLFTFFFELEYFDKKTGENKSLQHFPHDIREKLRKHAPDTLPDIAEYQWASKLAYRYVIDAIFAKNLLPEISINGRSFPGYRFDLSENLLTTSLTARSFIDATMAYNEYVANPAPGHLKMLIKSLYFSKVKDPEQYLEQVSDRVSFAILLNFQAVLAFLMNKTRYSLIWSRTPKKQDPDTGNKLSIGLADSMYMLSKDGYGSVSELSRENLITYLDLLLKNIIDAAKFMHENDSSIEEIATETGLTVNQVKKII